MNGFDSVILDIAEELKRARSKFPEWPRDAIHGAAIVVEEAGELQAACLKTAYESKPELIAERQANIREEAVQTAAMAIRFLQNLDRMNNQPSEQFNDALPL